MSMDRKAAVWIGVLYIIGTVVFVLSYVVTGAVLTGPAYLAQVAAQPNKIAVGALLGVLAGAAGRPAGERPGPGGAPGLPALPPVILPVILPVFLVFRLPAARGRRPPPDTS